MGCLSDTQLYDLLEAPEEHKSSQTHLGDCTVCQQRLEGLRADASRERRFVEWLPPRRVSIATSELTSSHTISIQPESASKCHPPEQIPGYEIIREISDGGQGVVYEAIQHAAKRTVAIKVLKGGLLAGERARWRFEQEIRLIASLRHPNIVVVHDSGITHGRYFYAMDYVRGQPLDTHVRLAKLDLKGTVCLFQQVCVAVGYAHRRGVIHRDLKPSNVLVSENGVPCVLDFGLAKIIGEQEDGKPAVSIPGTVLGTLAYLSPEQTLGNPDLDTRSDVYALGVILYRLLAGKPPYDTDKDIASACKAIREVDPPRPSHWRPEIPSDLDAVILKAMAKEPERRYDSASDLAEDLSAWLEGRPVSAKSASSLYVLRKLAIRHGFESLTIAAVLLILFSSLGILGHFYARERHSNAVLVVRNQQVESLNQQLRSQGPDVRAERAREMMGWFLAEWRAGHLGGARKVQSLLPDGSPLRLAMAFLLDSQETPEDLLQRIPSDEQSMAHFVIAERYDSQGRREEAVAERRLSLQSGNGIWGDLVLAELGQATSNARQDSKEKSR